MIGISDDEMQSNEFTSLFSEELLPNTRPYSIHAGINLELLDNS
jgi:hypothetical protein